MTDDVRKLLGGYATGTLTEPERQRLFAAALEDQALFEALADEHALRELLEDASARAVLLQATEQARFSIAGTFREWISRPKGKVLAGLACVAVVAVAVQSVRERSFRVAEQRTARLSAPAAPPASAPPAAQAPLADARDARNEKQADRPAGNLVRMAPRSETAPAAPSGAAPQAEALAITPPPPKAEQADSGAATQVAASGRSEIRYTLLRRTPDGDDIAVPPGYGFDPADRVRLRVEPGEDGTLLVRDEGGATLFSGAVSAGTPVLVPGQITFDQRPSRAIDVRFSASLPPPSASKTALRSSGETASMRSADTGVVTTRIILRRKID